MKKQTGIIIDGIFLEKAIGKTSQIYSDMYPDKMFDVPDFKIFIEFLLAYYNTFETEDRTIDCYLLLSDSFGLEYEINIDMEKTSFSLESGFLIKMRVSKSDDFIAFEACDILENLALEKNIILVANDRSYEPVLDALEGRGANIVVVTFDSSNGTPLHSRFPWGDVMLPLGRTYGLTKDEL